MMSITPKQKGFSLAEVLLAVCTLAIGMSFIGGTFLVAIHLSTVSTERTIAAVVADEAFAKVRMYATSIIADPNDPNQLIPNYYIYSFPTVCTPVNNIFYVDIPDYEFAYPSTKITVDKQYYWSALCRKTGERLIQVTVFVSRKIGRSIYPGGTEPVPEKINVSIVPGVGNENLLTINDIDKQFYINDGYTVVSNMTGRLYRVLKRNADNPNMIILDKSWLESDSSVWVVPPPVGGGRYPCIAIYQQIIRF